jgi:hypothetical protein
VNDVVGDVDLHETLSRGFAEEAVAAQADLARRLAGRTTDRADRVLDQPIRVPEVGLEEQELPAWLEQAMKHRQVLGVSVVAEDAGAHDVIEALSRKVSREILNLDDVGGGKSARLRLLGEIRVEGGGCEGVLAAENGRQMACPETAPCSDLEN